MNREVNKHSTIKIIGFLNYNTENGKSNYFSKTNKAKKLAYIHILF